MSAVRIDVTRWPLVAIAFRGTPSDADVAAGLQALTAQLAAAGAAGQRVAAVIDATRWSAPGLGAQAAMARWFAAEQDRIRAGCVAVALVLPGAITRALVQGLLAGRATPCPVRLFAAREPAERWARGQLGATAGDPGGAAR